jgi:hypothetical protein
MSAFTQACRYRICSNTGWSLLAALLFLVAGSVYPQGSLAPPSAPAATMKSLTEIEPRINIQRIVNPLPSDANYHYIISKPGAYYLSGNISATKASGIHVTVSGVTIDLNGFQITRATGTGGDGITFSAGANLCAVRNGVIAGFARGVNCLSSSNSFFQLKVSGCSVVGLSSGDASLVEDCQAYDNGNGVSAGLGSLLNRVVASNNHSSNAAIFGISAGTGSTITDCVARNNISSGAPSGGIQAGDYSTVISSTATSNTTPAASSDDTVATGILVGGTCMVTHCNATGNSGAGMRLDVDSQAIGCTVVANGSPPGTGAGIAANSRVSVKDCNVTDNYHSGVVVSGAAALIVGNHVVENSARGIDCSVGGGGNHIEGNQVVDNQGVGIAATTGDIVIRNSAHGNHEGETIVDYSPDSGFNFGPIQSPSDATNPMANIAF